MSFRLKTVLIMTFVIVSLLLTTSLTVYFYGRNFQL